MLTLKLAPPQLLRLMEPAKLVPNERQTRLAALLLPA